MVIGRRDLFFSFPLYFLPYTRLSSYRLRLFLYFISFQSCCSHAWVRIAILNGTCFVRMATWSLLWPKLRLLKFDQIKINLLSWDWFCLGWGVLLNTIRTIVKITMYSRVMCVYSRVMHSGRCCSLIYIHCSLLCDRIKIFPICGYTKLFFGCIYVVCLISSLVRVTALRQVITYGNILPCNVWHFQL